MIMKELNINAVTRTYEHELAVKNINILSKDVEFHSQEQLNNIINDPEFYFLYQERIGVNTYYIGLLENDVDFSGDTEYFNMVKTLTNINIHTSSLDDHPGLRKYFTASSDIDKILSDAANSGRDILVVVSSGLQLIDRIGLYGIWPYMELNKDTLLFAKITDDNAKRNVDNFYWNIHPAIFAINLDLYRKIGCPKFTDIADTEINRGIRSEENMRSNYTPKYLIPSEEYISKNNLKFNWGSNLIHETLKNGYSVHNLSWAIRNASRFWYADHKDERLELKKELFNSNLKIHQRWNVIFFHNSEGYEKKKDLVSAYIYKDKKLKHYDSFDEFFDEYGSKIDSYCSVASGFLTEYYYYVFKLKLDKMLIFDINNAGVNYKEWLYMAWKNSKDVKISSLLNGIRNSSPESKLFFDRILQTEFNNYDFMDKFQDFIIDHFDGNFDKIWSEIRDTRKIFMPLDIINSPRVFDTFDIIREKGYQLIMTSNIFQNKKMVWERGGDEGVESYFKEYFDNIPPKTIMLGDMWPITNKTKIVIKD